MTYTMKDMIKDILDKVYIHKENRKQGDVERTNFTEAFVCGQARIFKFLGVVYDIGTWQDGDFAMIGYLMIDGVELVNNGKIDWNAYDAALTDEAHHWATRELTVA